MWHPPPGQVEVDFDTESHGIHLPFQLKPHAVRPDNYQFWLTNGFPGLCMRGIAKNHHLIEIEVNPEKPTMQSDV